MKKDKITEDPEAFNVVKPENKEHKIPKLIKVIIGLIFILIFLFIFWELYQVYEVKDEEIKVYDGVSTISNSNIKPGNVLVQKIDLKNFDVSYLTKRTSDNLSYEIFNTKLEYDEFLKYCTSAKTLTEEDFNNFIPMVFYKKGKDISYENRYSEQKYDNILLTEIDTLEEKLTLLVLPRVKETNVNIVIKNGDKIFLGNTENVLDKLHNNLDLFSEYFSRRYFNNEYLTNATFLIEDVKLVNDRANEFFLSKGDLQEPTGERITYWQAYVYLEQNTKYVLRVLIDCESGELVGAYDVSK